MEKFADINNDILNRINSVPLIPGKGIDDNRDIRIMNVPTWSSRREMVTGRLNTLIKNKPEYTNTVFALLSYSTQKWAQQTRESLGLGSNADNELLSVIGRANEGISLIESKTGIKPHFYDDNRLLRLQESDKLLKCIEIIPDWLKELPKKGELYAKIIKTIHYLPENDVFSDISYDVCKDNYYDAVEYVCEFSYPYINELVPKLGPTRWLYGASDDSEYRYYHDTKTLVHSYKALMHGFGLRREYEAMGCIASGKSQRDADGLYLINIYEKAVDGLLKYPDKEHNAYRIITRIMKGMTDREIMEETHLSNSKYYSLKTLAINLLSYLLWGYSTVEILNGIILTPTSRRQMQQIRTAFLD